MTEWLLIIILGHNGKAIDMIKVPDKASCYRAAAVATRSTSGCNIYTSCTEITKEKK